MIPFPASETSLILENLVPVLPLPEVPPRRPRIWTVFAVWIVAAIGGLMAMMAGFVAVGIVVGFMMGMQGADSAAIELRVQEVIQQPLMALLLSLVPFQLGMAVVVLLAARWSPEPLKQRLALMPAAGRKFGALRLGAMAAFTLSTALAIVLGSALLLGLPPANPIGVTVSEGSWWTVMLASVLVSLVPAMVEEIVFRGYIQRRLLARWSPAMAIGVSTLLFALVHIDSLQHMIAVVPLGLVTGLVAWRTGSIKPAMLLHALHNAGAVGFGALVRALAPTLGDEGLGQLIIGIVAALALVGLPAVITLLWRTPSNDDPMTFDMPSMAVEPLSSQAV